MQPEAGDEKRRALFTLPLLSQLAPEIRDELQALCRVRRHRAGQMIVEEGDKTGFVGCVLSGFLRMQKTLADGRQHIVGLLVEGDMFGRVFDGATEFSIEAATDVEFCAFPRARFERMLAKHPDLDRIVLLIILNELDRARDWMIILSNQKVSSRLAGFFLVMTTRYHRIDHLVEPREGGIEIRIPISRIDLAHLLGTRTESISRALHWLADQGDIDVLEPDRILLRNPQALAEKAGEDALDTAISLKDHMIAKRAVR